MSSPTTPEPRALDVEGLREKYDRALGGSLESPAGLSYFHAVHGALPALLDAVEERGSLEESLAEEIRRHREAREEEEAARGERDRLREDLDSTITALGEIQDRALAERAAHARTREALRELVQELTRLHFVQATAEERANIWTPPRNRHFGVAIDRLDEKVRAAQALLEEKPK